MLFILRTTTPVNLEGLLQDTHQKVRFIRTNKRLNSINEHWEHCVDCKMFDLVVFALLAVTKNALEQPTQFVEDCYSTRDFELKMNLIHYCSDGKEKTELWLLECPTAYILFVAKAEDLFEN